MTRDEFLASIKTLTGIDIPTQEEQSVIESMVNAFDERTDIDARISSLEAELAAEREEHDALRKRFRESFWGGSKMKGGRDETDEKKNAYDISMNDLFN